ncbi:MAG TPA: hypothetical protein PLV55_05990 [Anaerohalosphaeraceae bacterium]|nr:hypothetical protein [Anaerohalosphaeraceae bacterium]
MKTAVLSALCLLAAAAGFGCAALSEYITPARIDPKAVQYAAEAGAASPADFEGWQNLEKAVRLKTAVDAAHQVNQFTFQQMMEKDNLDYALLSQTLSQNLQAAKAREAQLFGESGLLSLFLTMAGFGGFTGLLGLLRKRPGDITPEEMESALQSIRGELTEKDRKILELVKGIQAFLDTYKQDNPTVVEKFKSILDTIESPATKEEVAKLKATLI